MPFPVQHLSEVAEARFGKDTQEAKAWLSARQEQLKTNQLDAVLSEIRAWRPSSAAKRQLRVSSFAYFSKSV